MNISFGDILFTLIKCSFSIEYGEQGIQFRYRYIPFPFHFQLYSISSISSLQFGHNLFSGFYKVLSIGPVSMASLWLLNRNILLTLFCGGCW